GGRGSRGPDDRRDRGGRGGRSRGCRRRAGAGGRARARARAAAGGRPPGRAGGMARRLIRRARQGLAARAPDRTRAGGGPRAAALMRQREVNAQWSDDAILLHPTANIGLAVAAPQGLLVPVIRAAERLTLAEIAVARSDLVTRARQGKLQREDLEDGTFTISNLGMYSVE